MEDFRGGEDEPDESVDEDENAKDAPDKKTRAIEWLRSCIAAHGARELSCPTIPEAAQAAGNFR